MGPSTPLCVHLIFSQELVLLTSLALQALGRPLYSWLWSPVPCFFFYFVPFALSLFFFLFGRLLVVLVRVQAIAG